MKLLKKKINSKRIMLVPFKDSDVTNEYVEWMNDENITQYILKANQKFNKKKLRQFIKDLDNSNCDIFYRILLKESNSHIGNIRLGPINFKQRYSKFGILIGNVNYHRKGYAKEAIEMIIKFCFEELNLKLFQFECVCNNVAAMNLYKSMGFNMQNTSEKFVKNKKTLDQVIWYKENPNF